MTHQNFQTNGASLEDCHTNFFALTELSGIKWRKLVWSDGGGGGGLCSSSATGASSAPLDDPVLRSYARCLAADILCVWRRVPSPRGCGTDNLLDFVGAPAPPTQPPPIAATHPPPLSLAAAKELWIFWYGEEPDLGDLVTPELLAQEGDQGSWESGLSYECRSLLFKALHNLIERCLLSRDFVRIGKWFVQPHEGGSKSTEASSSSSTHLSFSFAFFVHGESTVCASVDVRQHPAVRKLTRWHLQQAQASSQGLQVMLAPFGLAGTLTGHIFKPNESTTRLLEDWGQFYPLDRTSMSTGDLNIVEVVVGSSKMRYPSCYVLVTDMDDSANLPVLNSGIVGGTAATAPTGAGQPSITPVPQTTPNVIQQNGIKNGSSTPVAIQSPPPSPVPVYSRVPPPGPFPVSIEHPSSMQKDPTAANVLPERTWQECILGGPPAPSPVLPSSVNGGGGGGATTAPSSASSSTSTPSQQPQSQQQQCNNGQMTQMNGPVGSGGLLTSTDASSGTGGGNWDFVDPTRRANCTCSKCPGSYTPQGGPPSYPRTQESLAIPSVGSPPSVAPSPLPNPNSQPASVPPGEQPMPTLSPHPPTVAPSPADKAQTPTDEAPPTNAGSVIDSPMTNTHMDIKREDEGVTGGLMGGGATIGGGTTGGAATAMKRPALSSKEYEDALGEEEHTLDLLYDYSTLDAWLNHPVKRFKPDSKDSMRAIIRSGKMDLYSMYQQQSGLMASTASDLNHNNPKGQQPLVIKQEIKQEPICQMETDSTIAIPNSLPHGTKRPGDPYEFEEEGGGAACNMDGFKRGQNVKEEQPTKDSKKVSSAGNLFTSEGLQPSYRDLDQIFDNSDDTSGDEGLQVQTPPGSNKSTGVHEDTNKRLYGSGGSGGGSGHGTCSNIGILRPEELSKMFPTPPSLEPNPIASPCGQFDLPPPDLADLGAVARVKQEIYPSMGSPQEESIEDWSYVFKPPVICKMVGSSKYAPLVNLPSAGLPAVVLPPQCVYKPSWLQHMEKPMTTAPQLAPNPTAIQPVATTAVVNNRPSPNTTSSLPNSIHQNISSYPSSPSHSAPPGFRPPPPPYELPSPATSTASSYLNKNLNSVDAEPPPMMLRTPEASSLVVNILLGDTALNIFRDHNFDSCTLCVCNAGPKVVGNIQGADASVYLMNSNSSSSSTNPGDKIVGYGSMHQPNSPYPGAQGPPYGSMMSPPPPHHHNHHQGQQHHLAPIFDEDSIKCSCGFSAVVNRRLSHRSGLFYEDEMEITGIAEDPSERKKPSLLSFLLQTSSLKMDPSMEREQVDVIPHSIIELVREQCVMIQSTANSLYRSARYHRNNLVDHSYSSTVNILEFTDGNELTTLALEQSKQSESILLCKAEDSLRPRGAGLGSHHRICVHRWPFLRAFGPQCNQDIVRVMKGLQPLLQEAIRKKCQTRLWEPPSAVKGPLTWRQFHRLAGRGTDDRCEPQPVPSLIVGHEKDWLSLSPYAVHHWERLLLEPYSYARDVAYIVVAPDNDAILPRVRTFFKELSTAYETCRLGRHSPITKVLRDGILRVGKTAKTKLGNEPVEEWFTCLGEGDATDMLKLYAQVCKHHLAPHLQQVPMDKTLLDPPETTPDKPAPSPMPPPNTPDNNSSGSGNNNPTSSSSSSQNSSMMNSTDKAPSTPKSEQGKTFNILLKCTVYKINNLLLIYYLDSDSGNSKEMTPLLSSLSESMHDDDDRQVPCVVIYMVEPFSMGCDQPDLQRLACLALLRCFQSVLSSVPENIRSNISFQIISQESVMELGKSRDRNRHIDHMRALALSVFSQCRRLLVHTSNVKSLTGFGTAASADLFLKTKDDKNRAPYKMYSPPYILAPIKEKVEPVEAFGLSNSDQGCVLYLSYCLSDDQSWLLAVATDERGEICENVTINIEIPNRSKRKRASARRLGLQKLMDWTLGIMSLSVKQWRLVVGRLGRIGHGELKGWSWLLSRKNLLKASKHLKEICNQCSLMYPHNVPCILSACLVSLEPDSVLRLMPDQFTPDERFSQASVNSQLSTPQDVTCTHILVFPTSATTQSSQSAFQEQHINGPELGDDDLFTVLNDDMETAMQTLNDDFSDIFNWPESGAAGGQSPTGSPRREESSRPGSPTFGMNGIGRQGSPFPCNTNSRNNEPKEEVGQLLQQPLALGYFVSTAPTGKMPKWFWASCPHLEGVCPAFLKNALHLHSPSIQQSSDELLQQSAITSHPLDSQYTTDVLRYVLEGYNALSWLALDSNTQDRLSCLPVHIQVLIQLYHLTASFL
ncbi:mediator of RNA polymerase II transcription subunit 13 isoform X4 [Agrilus planipennis]|uniref:Mediator of RNA polymerase II transcription subunit 13 n=1 Tax=Agrilus planipennis TaxID=224129 RepID=A0A1W4WG31_AGRPL|nr:mediator of RNA polymerase II transcription subunit 13 isoform X4 [Agrilus planipennis]